MITPAQVLADHLKLCSECCGFRQVANHLRRVERYGKQKRKDMDDENGRGR